VGGESTSETKGRISEEKGRRKSKKKMGPDNKQKEPRIGASRKKPPVLSPPGRKGREQGGKEKQKEEAIRFESRRKRGYDNCKGRFEDALKKKRLEGVLHIPPTQKLRGESRMGRT